VSLNADGSVATYVFEGTAPDPGVLTPLEARLAPWGLTVVSYGSDAASD